MDDIERKVSFFAVGIAMVVAAVYLIEWIKKAPVTTSEKFVKGKACPSTFPHHVGDLCEHILKHDPSYWALKFLFTFVVALIILFFVFRRKRAGVTCFAIFLGLEMAFTGILFVFLGGWLVVRAFRLQRYGNASFSGSNKIAKEMAQARREGRDATPKSSKAAAAKDAPPGPVAPPSASKRYTPKQKPRKR